MRLDPIEILPYDPTWASSFAEQRARLHDCASAWLVTPVEHIGSTAVPGMPAKPIIDMIVVVADETSFAPTLSAIEPIGWLTAPEPGDLDLGKRSACFPTVERRTHHLHLVLETSAGWHDWLLLRDYLRSSSEARRRYARLKRALAAADDVDRPRYRDGKAPLIGELMREARSWRQDQT